MEHSTPAATPERVHARDVWVALENVCDAEVTTTGGAFGITVGMRLGVRFEAMAVMDRLPAHAGCRRHVACVRSSFRGCGCVQVLSRACRVCSQSV